MGSDPTEIDTILPTTDLNQIRFAKDLDIDQKLHKWAKRIKQYNYSLVLLADHLGLSDKGMYRYAYEYPVFGAYVRQKKLTVKAKTDNKADNVLYNSMDNRDPNVALSAAKFIKGQSSVQKIEINKRSVNLHLHKDMDKDTNIKIDDILQRFIESGKSKE